MQERRYFNMETSQLPIGERVAVLETRVTQINESLEDIKQKLDELLTLKAKGMGAIGLVTLVVGSGLLGLITICFQLFNRPHL